MVTPKWEILRLMGILALVSIAKTDVIDNGLRHDPIVECGQEGLTVRFMTQREFEGHVYVKGHYDDGACRKDATLEDSVNFTVPYTSCDVRRQRSSSPRGLFLSVTLIISFHPMFVTKIDRSYNVQCFYTEVEKTVTQALDVGMNPEQMASIHGSEAGKSRRPEGVDRFDVLDGVPEETITSTVTLPTCRYEVLAESDKGDAIKFATVGQRVYHRWTCEDPAHPDGTTPFCATVHSCSVREESGKQALLLDENGCSVDKYLLTNLVYTSALTGGQTSFVFKFADQPSLYFQCQIRLSLKENGECHRSSDNCPNTLRGKRDATSLHKRSAEKLHETAVHGPDVDVFSQSMTIFEIDDDSQDNKNSSSSAMGTLLTGHGHVCLSPWSFGLLISMMGTIVLVSIISLLLLCRRNSAKVSFLEQ
ncbi:unnamed protein product, partial [Mesorhabditis belari]|uniref:ZP domain-containing protein n=1 Tax=Mesorhabditis belari TaxID=2138241 RepID=A0AAF3FL00_9BILA